MDLKKTIIIQRVIILLAFITCVTATLCNYRQDLEIVRLVKENEKLSKCIEYQKSVIADLEENCRDLYIKNEKLKGIN
jgi:hypothetical protein